MDIILNNILYIELIIVIIVTTIFLIMRKRLLNELSLKEGKNKKLSMINRRKKRNIGELHNIILELQNKLTEINKKIDNYSE